MDKLPKVNIGVIAVICSSLGGMVWYASEQASIISNLQETVSVLTAENNTSQRVNMERDILANSDRIAEIIDYLVELEEEGQKTAQDVFSEIDLIYEDLNGLSSSLTDIIKLTARISILEKTIEFNTKDGM